MDLATCNENEPAGQAGVQQSAAAGVTGMAPTAIDAAARGSEQAARASADVVGCNTETAQDTLQADQHTAAQSFQRMTDQLAQVLGFNGPQAEEQTLRASQNFQAVTQASTVLVRGAQEVSQELIGLVQERLTKRAEGLNRMASCRSVRAFVAAQSELMRDNVQLMIDTNRRIAALSARIADEAASALQAQADDRTAHTHRAA